jgi:hypothetical protein
MFTNVKWSSIWQPILAIVLVLSLYNPSGFDWANKACFQCEDYQAWLSWLATFVIFGPLLIFLIGMVWFAIQNKARFLAFNIVPAIFIVVIGFFLESKGAAFFSSSSFLYVVIVVEMSFSAWLASEMKEIKPQ